jgi:large repetitive protein
LPGPPSTRSLPLPAQTTSFPLSALTVSLPPRATSARATDATFVFDAVDSGGSSVASFECRLDGAQFASCTSPLTVSGLARTSHTFAVRAVDAVGNRESSPVEYSWRISSFFAENDSASTLEETAASIDVLGNDVSPQGAPLTVAPASPTSSMGGTLIADGDGMLRYVPPADFHGVDSFTYTASTGDRTTEPATVLVTVAEVNDAPTFTAGAVVTVGEDSGTHRGVWATGISAGPGEDD